MEADFQRYYQLELAAALWGPEPIGLRRAISLVKSLPLDSQIAMTYTKGMAWTIDTELIALIAELTHTLIRVTAATGGAKQRDLPKQLEIDRPYQPSKPKKKQPATIGDLAVVLGGTLDIE